MMTEYVVEAGWNHSGTPFHHPLQDAGIGRTVEKIGGPTHVALPAAINAHDHGRAVSTVAAGVPDDILERWIPATQRIPVIDPGLEATVAVGRMARAGIAATQICHDAATPEAGIAGAVAIAEAARKVGIRVEISLPVYDLNHDGYLGPDGSLRGLPVPGKPATANRGLITAPVTEQLAAVEEATARAEGNGVTIAFHTVGLPWCSPALLRAIAERSSKTGQRVFMHLLETGIQRRWADAAYEGQPLRMLDEVGLLSGRLACAHGVHLRQDEIELLAERGVTLSVNTSSNLRLASGIAPAAGFMRAGLRFGLGLDSFGWSDRPDPWSEARLFRLVHRGVAPGPHFSDADVLAALSFNHRPGDIVLMNMDRLAPDRLDSAAPLSLVMARGSSAQVTDLLVEGKPVVRDGQPLGIDLDAAEAELIARLRSSGV